MKQVLIFDLSEVLIAGLPGVERTLSTRLSCSDKEILSALGGDLMRSLCCDEISEDEYISRITARERWDVSSDELKSAFRLNFHHRIPGMGEILTRLANRYELILLSDHAREWVDYIHEIHPFLNIFKEQYFSFELKQMKQVSSTFTKVLKDIRYYPNECLFIDDSQRNIDSAATVGVMGIRFENAEQLLGKLSEISML